MGYEYARERRDDERMKKKVIKKRKLYFIDNIKTSYKHSYIIQTHFK